MNSMLRHDNTGAANSVFFDDVERRLAFPVPELTPFDEDPYDMEEAPSMISLIIVVTKVVSLLSAMGSGYIICSMAINWRTKLKRTFDRMLLGLCASDLISSTSFFFGSWAIPKEPPIGFEDAYGGPGYWDKMFPQAAGNELTCTLQGYSLYLGSVSSVFFTGCIAITFLLQVKFRFREKQMRIAEQIFFGVCLTFPLLTSLLVLSDRGYNPTRSGFCFINTDPFICSERWLGTWFQQEEEIWLYCTEQADVRGTKSSFYYKLLCAAPLALALLIITISMGIIFWSVRTQEMRVARWSSAAASRRDQKRVFVQSMLYIGAFVVVWVPNICFLFIKFPKSLQFYIVPCLLPLQGFLNVLIYSNLFNMFKATATSVRKSVRKSIRLTWSKQFESSTESNISSSCAERIDVGLKSSSIVSVAAPTELFSAEDLGIAQGTKLESTDKEVSLKKENFSRDDTTGDLAEITNDRSIQSGAPCEPDKRVSYPSSIRNKMVRSSWVGQSTDLHVPPSYYLDEDSDDDPEATLTAIEGGTDVPCGEEEDSLCELNGGGGKNKKEKSSKSLGKKSSSKKIKSEDKLSSSSKSLDDNDASKKSKRSTIKKGKSERILSKSLHDDSSEDEEIASSTRSLSSKKGGKSRKKIKSDGGGDGDDTIASSRRSLSSKKSGKSSKKITVTKP